MTVLADKLAAIRQAGDAPLPLDRNHLTEAFELGAPYKVAILHLLLQRRLILNDPVGFGKTACALGAYAYFCRQYTAAFRPILLVLATDSSQFQWRSEVRRLTDFSAEVLGYLGRTPLAPEARQARFLADLDTNVWITTYSTAARDLPTLLQRPRILVADEVQILRGGGQSRFVKTAYGRRLKRAILHPAAKTLSETAAACWGLTATPLMKDVEDIWGIYDLVAPGLLGTRTSFRKRYVRTLDLTVKKTGQPFEKVIGYKNVDELARRIAPYTLARTEAQLGPFLPKILPLRRIDVAMGPAQRKVYDDCLNGLPDARGLTRKQKLHAVLHAQMITDTPEVLGYDGVPSAKWDALARFVTEEIPDDQQVVIYTFFRSVAVWLHRKLTTELNVPTSLIHGELNAPAKETARSGFENRKARLAVITSAAIYGVNLRAPVFLFYDLPWVWGDAVQAVGRARRRALSGMDPGNLLVAALVSTRTVNEDTIRALRRSQEASKALNTPLQKLQNYSAFYADPGMSTNTSRMNVVKTRRSKDWGEVPLSDLWVEDQDQTLISSQGDVEGDDTIESLFASLKGHGAAPTETEAPLPTFSADEVL